MSTDRGLDTEGVVYVYNMEHYATINKSEAVSSATTWMDLDSVVLSEVREGEIIYDMLYISGI